MNNKKLLVIVYFLLITVQLFLSGCCKFLTKAEIIGMNFGSQKKFPQEWNYRIINDGGPFNDTLESYVKLQIHPYLIKSKDQITKRPILFCRSNSTKWWYLKYEGICKKYNIAKKGEPGSIVYEEFVPGLDGVTSVFSLKKGKRSFVQDVKYIDVDKIKELFPEIEALICENGKDVFIFPFYNGPKVCHCELESILDLRKSYFNDVIFSIGEEYWELYTYVEKSDDINELRRVIRENDVNSQMENELYLQAE